MSLSNALLEREPVVPAPLQKNRLWLSQNIAEPEFDGSGGYLFYVRTADGRRSLIRQDLASGLVETISAEPAPRANVGYGGGTFAVRGGLLVYAAGGQLVALHLDTGTQKAVTPRYEGLAAPALSPCGRFAAFVIEHEGHAEVLLVDTDGAALPVKLTGSPAFAANPTFSGDGARLGWMEWDADRMPWDQCLVRIARFAQAASNVETPAALLPLSTGTLSKPDVSYANPQFSPDGRQLAYTSDESGWRLMYVSDCDGCHGERIDTGAGEIGQPDWTQGQFAVRWGKAGRSVYAVRRYRSNAQLVRVALPERKCEVIDSEWTSFGSLVLHPDEPDLLAYLASSPTSPLALVTRSDSTEAVRASTTVGLNDLEGLVTPEVIEWPTSGGVSIYGIFYRALDGDGPRPLLVTIHGGPTSESPNAWNPVAEYFAGKGWHVLVVNHRGGTGSGREYQDMLNGAWGVVDVEDSRSGAEHLIGQGLVDPKRVAITGGSAGGYTTLMALVKDPDFWTAGVSLYGIGNLYECRVGSHRFEARYEDGIVGPLPETAERWVERSALTHVRNVKAPLLLFHGKEDAAVPYQQSVEFADAVRAQGGIVDLVLYEDEGHGFTKEQNRKDQLETMESFLEKYVINLQGRR